MLALSGFSYAEHPKFTAPSALGDYVFRLIVNDGKLDSDPNNVTVTVVPAAAHNVSLGSGVTSTGKTVPAPKFTDPITTPVINIPWYNDPMELLIGGFSTQDCTDDRPFLLQTVRTEPNTTISIAKMECANLTECYEKWWLESSDENICQDGMQPD